MSVTPPESFRHETKIQVRWSDMDALGHVNNATYLTYIEQARIGYFTILNLWDGNQTKVGLIIAKITVDYKAPLYTGDDVRVFTRCSRLGNRSLETEQIVMRLKDEQLETAALASVTAVVFDYQTKQSTAIPPEWRSLIPNYEPGQVAQ